LELEIRKFITCPFESIADIDHGAIGEGYLWAQTMVDTDRDKTALEEEAGLCWPDVFA
jgi:hypothetical protein